MRVRIIFNLENKGSAVPFHHQNLLSGFIKKLIVKEAPEKYGNFTFYTFSGLKGHTKVSRKGLHFFSKRVTLVLSSSEKEFVDFIINAFFNLKTFELGALKLTPIQVDIEHPPVFEDNMKFICISPIVLTPPQFDEKECKAFVSPTGDRFSELLQQTVINRMRKFGIADKQLKEYDEFRLKPDGRYLKKIKESGKKFARIYPVYQEDIKYDLRGYTMPFSLDAPKEVNEFVYTCGLGVCTNKGFGMIDIVGYMDNKVIETYKSLEAVTDNA